MNQSVLAIVAASLAIPTVAAAAPKPDNSSATASSVASARAPRYCVVDTVTGSRIEHRTCKSLEAWLSEGVDPRAKK